MKRKGPTIDMERKTDDENGAKAALNVIPMVHRARAARFEMWEGKELPHRASQRIGSSHTEGDSEAWVQARVARPTDALIRDQLPPNQSTKSNILNH